MKSVFARSVERAPEAQTATPRVYPSSQGASPITVACPACNAKADMSCSKRGDGSYTMWGGESFHVARAEASNLVVRLASAARAKLAARRHPARQAVAFDTTMPQPSKAIDAKRALLRAAMRSANLKRPAPLQVLAKPGVEKPQTESQQAHSK